MTHATVSQTTQTSREKDWALHVRQWEESNLSQPVYCKQAGIGYAAFVYWRGKLKQSSQPQPTREQFVPARVVANHAVNANAPKSIQVKLVSGHIVYIPATISMDEIAVLLKALGGSNA